MMLITIINRRLLPLMLILMMAWISVWPTISAADVGLGDVTFGDGALSFSAGFIRQDVVPLGVMARTQDNKTILGKGDQVYLRLNRLDEVTPGELYTLYRQAQRVFHPATRQYLGDLINIVGIVRITKISHEFAVATIERSYGPIMPGNGVMAFTVPQEVSAPTGRSFPDMPGMIVEMQMQHTLVAQRHKVYVDWGREDGLAVGDRLEVFRVRRGLPDQLVGEVKVVALEDRTATGIVERSTAPLYVGDRFVFKQAASEVAHESGPSDRVQTINMQTKAHQTLTKGLGTHIASGEVSVRQEGDKIKINLGDLVDQLEYESGHAPIKPDGLKILKQISDILKTMTDEQILIEGHTDNMPIGPSLMAKFQTNQELSEARANLIVRYFMEEGIDPSSLSAVGYADKKPAANNRTEEGRRKNRRIEIELSPKGPLEPTSVPTLEHDRPPTISVVQ